MKKEVSTFHSGRYLFSSEVSCDLSVIAESMNVFCRMPLFPETVTELKTDQELKAALSSVKLEDSSVTMDQAKSIVSCTRENFSQDTMAIEFFNLFSSYNTLNSKAESKLSQELISELHSEQTVSLPHLKDAENSYRKGGIKADEQWLSVPYSPPGSPLDINFLIKHLIEWLESDLSGTNPIIKAFLLHLHLKKIQPYYNANGHTARLAESWYLLQHGFKILPFLLPVIYNVNKTEYYRAVSEFYQTSDITAFTGFVSEALKKTVEEVRDANFEKYYGVISAGYLNRLLDEKIIIKRQFDFLNMLKDENLIFCQEDLQLKKPFTRLYGKVSRTTVSRDVKKFEELGLIKQNGAGYAFNTDLLG